MLNSELIKSLLIGKSFICKIYFFDKLESTNDFARNNQLQDGSLIITNHQTGGRGRLQRKWESEKNKNLTFTILKNFELKPKDQISLVYFFAYSVFSVISKYINELNEDCEKNSLSIKWPNDILLNNKKIAGILIETKPKSRMLAAGIGINVNQLSFSEDISNFTSSVLAETNKQLDLNNLLIDIIKEIQQNLILINNYKLLEIFSLWKKNNKYIGKEVTFLTSNGEKKQAIVDDISPDGKIFLSSHGQKYSFISNDIKLQI